MIEMWISMTARCDGWRRDLRMRCHRTVLADLLTRLVPAVLPAEYREER